MDTGKKEKYKLKRIFSAGGVVYRKNKNILWLVTKSTPSKLYPKSVWRLPKGWLDDTNIGNLPGSLARGEKKATDKELRQAAIKEVKEEGGVKAKIKSKIGTITFFFNQDKQKYLKFVTFFLMEWEKNLKKGFGRETQETKWLPFKKATKILSYKSEREILKKAASLL